MTGGVFSVVGAALDTSMVLSLGSLALGVTRSVVAAAGRRAAAEAVESGALNAAEKEAMAEAGALGEAGENAVAKNFGECFPPGTLVHTSSGAKPIEEIVVGDQVWSFHHWELRWVERSVLEFYRRQHVGLMATIGLEGETIRATGGHPFWVVAGEELTDRPLPRLICAHEEGGRQAGRWVLAKDLRVGDEVLRRDGIVSILESVELDETEELVYNFQVEELQNYAVGSFGVLVHNTNREVGGPHGPGGQARPAPNAGGGGPKKLPGQWDSGTYPKPPGWGEDWNWGPATGEAEAGWRWFDPKGGEWRFHAPDKWHPEGHWDYNPWNTWNSPWQNIYPPKS